MPAPLMHVALAIIAIQGPFSGVDKKSFIVGTCFPDIRYLKVIEREKTHVKNITLDQLAHEKNAFKLGYLFHSFVDQLFDNFMTKHNIYEKLPKSQLTPQGFKIFTDKVLYKQMEQQLPGIIDYFDDVILEELSWGIDRKNIVKWHEFLKKYFSSQYQCDLCSLAKEYSLLPGGGTDTINSIIAEMNGPISQAEKFVLDFYNFASKQIKKRKNILTTKL